MKRRHSSTEAGRGQAGFGIIEILVAVTLGMIASVAMFGILQSSETRKRTASGASEAEAAGLAGGFGIERELKLAGYGFVRSGVLGCEVSAVGPTGSFKFRLLPVTITQGASGAPDTIEIIAGASPVLNDPVAYTGAGTARTLANAAGFFAGDAMLVATGTGAGASCGLAKIANATGNVVEHESMPTPIGAPGVAVGFGRGIQRTKWEVTGGRLIRTDLSQGNTGTAQEVSDVVIDLQAEYGYDADGNGQVATTEWVTALPAPFDPLRLVAVRFATLSRSGQFDKEPVTTTAPAWTGGAFAMRNVDGTADANAALDPNNWRHYRYRVHQYVVPLRNLLWGRA